MWSDTQIVAVPTGRRAATGCGWRTRAGRSPRGAGSRARPWSSRRPCRARARAGTRGSRRARASGRRGRTGRPRTAAGTGSTLRSSVAPGLHREVLELDPLAAVDRGVDLRQAARQLGAAGRRGDAEADRALGGRVERARAAPGDLLEREPQRLGVGELAVEQAERRLQGGELGVGELDRRQVERAARERVVLLLGEPVGRLVDAQVDAERVELRPVGVEAASEGVLRHVGVAFDVATDLRGGDRTPFRHQVGDQRELSDELLGVLRQGPSTLDMHRRQAATVKRAGFRSLRSFDPLHHEVVTGVPLSSLRLVLVEDHEALREGLELLLGREGCTVVGTAGSLDEGAALIAETEPDVARGRHPPRRGERHRAHAAAAGRKPGPARSCSTRARATPTCCSTRWTPAPAATRSRRGRRASWSARSRPSRTAARTSTRGCARRCCRAAPRSGCRRCPRASARSWTCWRRA